jgi:hypothetical protein
MVPDPHATPTDLLAQVRGACMAVRSAEVELIELAVAWADAHPDLSDPRDRAEAGEGAGDLPDDPAIPPVHWAAGAPFAAAIGRATQAGEALIRDGLVLRHRLPAIWARVRAGQVEVWRARRIAQVVHGQPADVARHLDATLADVAHRVGPRTLDRLLDEAMLLLYPEERELAQLEALDRRHATLHEGTINDAGVVEMTLRGDFKDLADFSETLTRLATALAAADEAEGRYPDSLDVRRSRAVGVLADPATAQALLEGRPSPRPIKRMQLVVHLSSDAITGHDLLGRCETMDASGPGQPVLAQQVRDWAGRTDTHLTVVPVIDLNDHVQSEAYEISNRLRTRADLVALVCVFPFCTRTARRCDHDHVIAHGEGGATCDCNIAPVCRHHHRIKTHQGWTYTRLEPGTWLWSEPHGQQFLRNGHGTLDVTPPDRRVNNRVGRRAAGHDGCRERAPADTG